MELILRKGAFGGETHIVTGAAQGIGNRVAAMADPRLFAYVTGIVLQANGGMRLE